MTEPRANHATNTCEPRLSNTTAANAQTIDEAPMAYKPMEEIVQCIQDTVEIVDIIRPIYNFKAAEDVRFWKKENEQIIE